MRARCFGSIVGLRPEWVERYKVLHEHVFAGVLDRLARSNIRNYSIFLGQARDDAKAGPDGEALTLFSHLEYTGADHAGDMAAMAADETTKQWWTLTDPMQVPLPERAEGDWWAALPEWHAIEAGGPGRECRSGRPPDGVRVRAASRVSTSDARARFADAGRRVPGEHPRASRVRRAPARLRLPGSGPDVRRPTPSPGRSTARWAAARVPRRSSRCSTWTGRRRRDRRSSSPAASTCSTAATSRSCRRRPASATCTSASGRTGRSSRSRGATRSTPRPSVAT